jgi:hypothetical protein
MVNNNQGAIPSQRNKQSLFQQFLNSSNPNEFLQNLISNNPKMQNVYNLMQSSGMSPKDFFYNYAQQNGVDPDQFLNSLKS